MGELRGRSGWDIIYHLTIASAGEMPAERAAVIQGDLVDGSPVALLLSDLHHTGRVPVYCYCDTHKNQVGAWDWCSYCFIIGLAAV